MGVRQQKGLGLRRRRTESRKRKQGLGASLAGKIARPARPIGKWDSRVGIRVPVPVRPVSVLETKSGEIAAAAITQSLQE